MTDVQLMQGDCRTVLAGLAAGSVACVVTSPPYNMGASPSANEHPHSSHGLELPDWRYEDDPDNLPETEYQAKQRAILAALYRVCAEGANLFYVHKDRIWGGVSCSPRSWLEGGPWTIRQQIVWDRGSSHNHRGHVFYEQNEWVFWLTKGYVPPRLGAGAALSSVWRIPVTARDRVSWHPCPFPLQLAERCVLAGSEPGDTVLDCYAGAGTTGVAALQFGRRAILIERQPAYIAGMRERLGAITLRHPALVLTAPAPTQAALWPD